MRVGSAQHDTVLYSLRLHQSPPRPFSDAERFLHRLALRSGNPNAYNLLAEPTCSNADFLKRSTSMTRASAGSQTPAAPGWRCSTGTMPSGTRPGRFADKTFRIDLSFYFPKSCTAMIARAKAFTRATLHFANVEKSYARLIVKPNTRGRLPSSLKSIGIGEKELAIRERSRHRSDADLQDIYDGSCPGGFAQVYA